MGAEETQKWDAIVFLVDGQRKGWHWCANEQSWSVRVEKPGDYEIQYRRNAGYFSDGTLYESLPLSVKNPVLQFDAPHQCRAGRLMRVSWRLAALVGPSYTLHLQVDD